MYHNHHIYMYYTICIVTDFSSIRNYVQTRCDDSTIGLLILLQYQVAWDDGLDRLSRVEKA